jgi:hypothetical protein
LEQLEPGISWPDQQLERRVDIERDRPPGLGDVTEAPVRVPDRKLTGSEAERDPVPEGIVERVEIWVEKRSPKGQEIALEEQAERDQNTKAKSCPP